MNFVADEGVDQQIVISLRSAGYDVLLIAEEAFGIKDEEVLSIANKGQLLRNMHYI